MRELKEGKRRVCFFGAQLGSTGAGIPLPGRARMLAAWYDGAIGGREELVAKLQMAYPDGRVGDYPPGEGVLADADYGMITLTVPAEGYPQTNWCVLKYRLRPAEAK